MLRVTGINAVIADLKRIQRSLEGSMHELIEELLNEGFSIASAGYASALTSGVFDVRVDEPKWEGSTMYLTARGETIAFIEFGTGIVYETYPDQEVYTKLGMDQRGEYGKGKAKNGKWVYVGTKGSLGKVVGQKKDGRLVIQTEGNPPARAMFAAGENLANQDHINAIARRVFNK